MEEISGFVDNDITVFVKFNDIRNLVRRRVKSQIHTSSAIVSDKTIKGTLRRIHKLLHSMYAPLKKWKIN